MDDETQDTLDGLLYNSRQILDATRATAIGVAILASTSVAAIVFWAVAAWTESSSDSGEADLAISVLVSVAALIAVFVYLFTLASAITSDD